MMVFLTNPLAALFPPEEPQHRALVETKVARNFSASQRLSPLHHVSCFQFEACLGNSYLQPTETKQQIISQLDLRWT